MFFHSDPRKAPPHYMHFRPHKTCICFCFQQRLKDTVQILSLSQNSPIFQVGWLKNIKMDNLGSGECSRRVRSREGRGVQCSNREKSTVWSTPSLAVHLQVTEGCHVSRRGLISHGGLAQMLLFMLSDADGNLCRSNQLLQVMLAMHRIIISSAELLQKVVTLYPLAQ